jgi:hypothetical protein
MTYQNKDTSYIGKEKMSIEEKSMLIVFTISGVLLLLRIAGRI